MEIPDFSYTTWTPDTVVTLTNVPWNSDYRDIVKFESRAALNAYIDTLETSSIKMNKISYTRPNLPVDLAIAFNDAVDFNYLRASAPITNVPGAVKAKEYYYFITSVDFVNVGVTRVGLQLDVWQTYGHDVVFGNCYIERGHAGIANEKAFDNYGRDYLTIPEGMDVGGEYMNIARRNSRIFNLDAQGESNVLVASTVDIAKPLGSVAAPTLHTAGGTSIQGLPSGANFYVLPDIRQFKDFMNYFSDKPWITQGFISITLIPNLSRYGYRIKPLLRANPGPGETPSIPIGPGSGVYVLDDENDLNRLGGRYYDNYTNWRESPEILENIPLRYRHLKKFLTYPYMVIEMTTFSGTPTIIKPESWADDNARVSEKISVMPPNQRVVVYPSRYNARKNSPIDSKVSTGLNNSGNPNGGLVNRTDYFDDGGDYLDMSTQISNFPTFAIVNNMAISFMASNVNMLSYQNQSAEWSQQRALAANQTSYDQAGSAIQTANKQAQIARAADLASTNISQETAGLSTLLSGAGQIAGGVAGGAAGVGGAALGAAGGALQYAVNQGGAYAQLGVRQGANADSTIAGMRQAGMVRDSNKELGDWAAKGDYANAIAGINARVQDAKLTQPSVSGQPGGEAFNIAHNSSVLSLRWKLVNNAELRAIGEYWLRYGYAIRQFGKIPASLMVMNRFTYWKLAETYITTGRMPETFKQTIRGIFEKGVTVWNNPHDIGNIDIADNTPLTGYTL